MSDDNAVSRRQILRNASAGSAALLIATLAAQPAAAAMAQKAAGYQPTPKDGKRCDTCTFFKAPSSCAIVEGTIAPTGWCRFYNKKQ
ncbi:MAG: high-potential iron-sulfur protein [Alphaproteobacteria bacterium]|nr:high-potential iron-sulfur protein [Alphaproteobacteria bacterium]MBL6937906.1 high-potential iron-sulfur protein [Alphaproteobacteria bacterium]MBL7099269.1 high-potential iron-sulfur protein [Alphaproteobacteria bacterium]